MTYDSQDSVQDRGNFSSNGKRKGLIAMNTGFKAYNLWTINEHLVAESYEAQLTAPPHISGQTVLQQRCFC